MTSNSVKNSEKPSLKALLRIAGVEERAAVQFKEAKRLELTTVGTDFESVEKMIGDIISSLKSASMKTFGDAPPVSQITNLCSPIKGVTMPNMDSSKFTPIRNAFALLKDSFDFIKEHGKLGIEYTLSYGVPKPTTLLNYVGVLNIKGNVLTFAETERTMTVLIDLRGRVVVLDDIIAVTFK